MSTRNLKMTNLWPLKWEEMLNTCTYNLISDFNSMSYYKIKLYYIYAHASRQIGSSPVNVERKGFIENHGLLFL